MPEWKIDEHRDIRARYPDVWKQYVALENEKVAFGKWNTYSDITLHDIEEILSNEEQMGEG